MYDGAEIVIHVSNGWTNSASDCAAGDSLLCLTDGTLTDSTGTVAGYEEGLLAQDIGETSTARTDNPFFHLDDALIRAKELASRY